MYTLPDNVKDYLEHKYSLYYMNDGVSLNFIIQRNDNEKTMTLGAVLAANKYFSSDATIRIFTHFDTDDEAKVFVFFPNSKIVKEYLKKKECLFANEKAMIIKIQSIYCVLVVEKDSKDLFTFNDAWICYDITYCLIVSKIMAKYNVDVKDYDEWFNKFATETGLFELNALLGKFFVEIEKDKVVRTLDNFNRREIVQ